MYFLFTPTVLPLARHVKVLQTFEKPFKYQEICLSIFEGACVRPYNPPPHKKEERKKIPILRSRVIV